MMKRGLILIIVTIGTVLCQDIINFGIGERVPGDELLHTETQHSQPTQDITQHSLIFVWRGNNETYSLIDVETNGYDVWHMVSPSDTTPYYLRYFSFVLTNRNVQQLQVTIRIYGLKNQYIETDSVTDYHKDFQHAITTTSGVNKH